jgi:hypothetical protein
MKNLITKLAIATILSMTLISVLNISSHFYGKALSYRTAALTQTQPGSEILSGSYGEMMNTLLATSGR